MAGVARETSRSEVDRIMMGERGVQSLPTLGSLAASTYPNIGSRCADPYGMVRPWPANSGGTV